MPLLNRSSCSNDGTHYPSPAFTITEDNEFSKEVRIKPQKVDVNLGIGE